MKKAFIVVETTSSNSITYFNAHDITSYVTTKDSIKIYLMSGNVIEFANCDDGFVESIVCLINKRLKLKYKVVK